MSKEAIKHQIMFLAIGDTGIFKIGGVSIEQKEDAIEVYSYPSFKGLDFHVSRHSSGDLHWKQGEKKVDLPFEKRVPMKDFSGVEGLGTWGLSVENHDEFHPKYGSKHYDGIFLIDTRKYRGAYFNVAFYILTKEGLPTFYSVWEKYGKRQIYLYANSHPMVGMIAIDAKEKIE